MKVFTAQGLVYQAFDSLTETKSRKLDKTLKTVKDLTRKCGDDFPK